MHTSEASSYHRDYRSSHPEVYSYVDPREHASTSVRRNRYDSPRRVRDVSWISAAQQPPPVQDPYAIWMPPPEHSEFPGQAPPVAHSSPMMRRTPSPMIPTAPSSMIREFMPMEEDEEDEEDEVLVESDDYGDDEGIHFEFPSAPEKHIGRRKSARRWVGGFVQSLRKFPGLRKSSRRARPEEASSLEPPHENEPQFPTISSLNLRPLTPSLIAQNLEYMEMPKPQVEQPPSPSPQHLHPYSHTRKPPPPAPSSPVYPPGADAVPQVLSTVSEQSAEHTGTQETHMRPHSPHPRSHSSHAHSQSQSQSQSHSHSSQSTAHPTVPNNTNPQTAPPGPSPWEPSAPTVTDYITVPPPPTPPPPPTGIKRFLHNLDQLPWVEHEQIVESYFPGRSSRHRRHPNAPPDGWKPAASWYNRRNDSFPIGMMGGNGALLYGWPSQIQKGYAQPEIQFPHGYAPAQPVFLYPSGFPPPGTYVDVPQRAM